jgi:dienelactone hydrolase
MRTLTGIAFMFLLAVTGAPAQSPAKNVDLRAADGTLIRATHFPAARPGPAVILLHMCNSQRGAWDRLGALLASKGIHAIAPDYRGYGESGGERLENAPREQARQVMRELWPGDLDVVYEYLMQQPGVDPSLVGAAGGSCGGGNAVELAKRHPEIRTLVLLA